MVRKFAAAAAVIGACAFITPAFGKGGGFAGGFHAAPRTGLAPAFARPHPSMRARPPLYTGLAPNFISSPHRLHGRHFVFRRFHQRRLGHVLAFGFGHGLPIAAPAVYEVPQYEEPAPGAVALWRGANSGTCSTEAVQVRGAGGMDEVNIVRC